ncbi:MAG TPA: bifunctional demethylmenaquinone methyltransferase/2-methoxy-6-polyprenyl-1,4-benzoquinol methylase UbiE [Trichormus sp.]|jgi:demethylmenaquinone methyltransferase/2-methoxy-6-polyprenyl-1,4-benzoquinol methylase
MPFRLPTKEEKADYVRAQFDRIARRYDLTNDAISMGMHRTWKHAAVTQLQLKSDGRYLDVCCGTGDLSLLIAQKLGKAGQVMGLDFSPKMLEVAKQRAASAKNLEAELEWQQGDAQQLPFPDDSFDAAIISFGLRNLTDLQRGVSEMARVVKPGGHVVNLDLGHSNVPLFSQMFQFYFSTIVPIIGLILQNDKNAYTYLPESLSTYPKPDGISKLFENAGMQNVKHIPLALGSVALHVGTVATGSGIR